MGKYGIAKGYGYFQNIQAGVCPITLDGSGDGNTSVPFSRMFKNIPAVIATAQTSDNTVTLVASGVSRTGFVLEADGSEHTSVPIYIGWVAIDDTRPSKN